MGEVLGAAVLAEGRRRAGGGVGETQAESLVGDAVEAVVDVVGESSVAGEPGVGTPGGGVAHRGRLLECDIEAAARGVFDGLLGLIVEVVAPQAVAGRSRGVRWARAHARPSRPTGGGCGLGPRGARWRVTSRGWGRERVCAFASKSREVLQGQARNVFGK